MSASFFSKLVTHLTGLANPGFVSTAHEWQTLPARDGLGIVIPKIDSSTDSAYVPGVSMLEGGPPIIMLPLGEFPARFRIDYIEDGTRGMAMVNESELLDARRDLQWQSDTFGYVMDLPKVVEKKNQKIS